jgi:predicted peptidase
VLLERLIKSFIVALPSPGGKPAQPLVNPNRVYLTGFYAGGDGVYRLSTGLSDLFAAVNMSADDPGAVQFGNLANVPIC